MTKEPIMIDDVDVAECIYYADGKCTNSQMIQSNCKNVAVCYYKEYKQKEQECDELKKERAFYSAEYTRVNTQLMSQDAYILIDGKEVWSGDNRKLKQQLDQLKAQLLDQEAETLKAGEIIDQLKTDNEKMSKGYEELTEIVSPYIDDFTGYNEKLKGFDIVLCIKELMRQFDQFKTYHNDTVRTMLQVECCLVDNCKKYEQALQEIKEIITNSFDSCYVCNSKDSCEKCLQGEILQKCEVIDD